MNPALARTYRPLPADALGALVVVLDAVRRDGAASRSAVGQLTGLGRAIVAHRVGELIDRGLLSEEGAARSTGGRPPRQLSFSTGAGHLLVADLGATGIDVALTNLSGAILAHLAEPEDIAAGPETVLDHVDALFAELLSGAVPGDLWGIGLGVPGPVEFGAGRPVSPPIMPGWDGYPIRERFAQRYTAPVWVDNDVNLLALGEWRQGAARGHRNVVVVKVGTGIGAGLISDGMLHRGAQGAAGDVGHIQVVDDPSVVCRCGNIGCLEAIAGGEAIARSGERLARDGRSPRLAAVLRVHGHVTAADVAHSASHGDAACFELLQRSGRLVGTMLAGIVNFFNPSLIVLGGGVSGAGDAYLAAVRGTLYRRSLPLATRDLTVARATLGEQGGVIGAAAMVLDELFSRDCVERWIEPGSPAGRPEIATSRD
jgi:glucokinase-like ROK family protein